MTFIDITPIAEMHSVAQTADALIIGGLVTLSETIAAMNNAVNIEGFEYMKDLIDHFELIANVPVRNVCIIHYN